MDEQRAKEISASPVMANVTYNETPIYIQGVNEQKGTAKIFPLNQPEKEQEVSLTSLKEH